jgi:nicotinamidase-related amidase
MPYISDVTEFLEKNRSFFGYLKEMEENIKPSPLAQIITQAGNPDHVAVISVDMIEGFCRTGVLASPRVEGIIPHTTAILERAYRYGIRNIAMEFGAFPPHCTEGSKESETIREFKELPFFRELAIIRKNSVNSLINTDLEKWLKGRNLRSIIVIGDCTDLCTYHLAMGLKFYANSLGLPWEIILPVNAVETYDLPVEIAKEIGAVPHPGDLMHIIFVYHMILNGIRVVEKI